MPKRKIHFIGFLANVDDSILQLSLGHPFTIEKKSQDEVVPFTRDIRQHYGTNSEYGILAVEDQVNGIVHNQSFYYYCVTGRNVESFNSTPQGGVVIKWGKHEEFHRLIQEKLRLLRLFKEGNISLEFSCIYHLKDSQPSVFGLCREWPIADKTKFHLEDNEISDAQCFIETTRIPFKEKYLQLAFDSFELSYESHNAALSFLSLMIAMEVMLNRSKQDELRYAISRNAAVLLGKDKDDSERVFKEVRMLYDKRSKLVHEGSANEISSKDVLLLRHYVREAIKEMQSISKDPKKIRDILNTCGFGQRPWRDGC